MSRISIMHFKKLIRITTVPISLDKLLTGQLHFMKQFYEVTAVSSIPDELEIIGKKEGVKTFDLEMTRQITPVQDIKAVVKLYHFLKKEKPFIVHTHTPKAGIVGMLAAKMAGVPNRLHTVAGLPLLEATGVKRKILEQVEKATFSCATKVYPNSFVLLDYLKDHHYAASNKLKVLGNGSSNGINTAYFSPSHFSSEQNSILKTQIGSGENDFVFIFVGRLVSDKGINELVAAFQKLPQTNRNVKLLLVGNFEAELDPLHENTLKVIDSNPNIILAGYQYDVRPYFAISNALIFPSYREGFPNVVMQAGAMSLPSIVSDINGCNEIIENGTNGLIVPVKDEINLGVAMEKLVEDENDTLKMVENSRPMIVSRYEQDVIWQAILSEYQNLERHV